MTRLLSSAVVSLAACQSAIGDAVVVPADAADPDAPSGEQPGNPDGDVTLRQNASDEIQPSHSIACVERDDSGDPVQNRENSYYRVFDLALAGVAGDFAVRSVQIGVESASTEDGAPQPVTVRLHTLRGELETAALEALTSVEVSVAPQEAALLPVPVAATVSAGSSLVAEVFVPSSTDGRLFFIGANDLGETAPGYLRAPAAGCNFVEPTPITDLGVGSNVHIVLTVTGTTL